MLRRRQVEQRTGLSRSTIYRMMAEGAFPLAVKVGAKAVRWSEREIDAWMAERSRLASAGTV